MTKHFSRPCGMTLIELLIVLAIISILSVVGWSQYQQHFHEGTRGDAIEALTLSANKLENCYARNIPNSYLNCSLTNLGTGKCSDDVLAKANDTTIYSRKCSWSITLGNLTENTYTLTASRTYLDNDGTTSVTDTMTLDHLGRKGGSVSWPQ